MELARHRSFPASRLLAGFLGLASVAACGEDRGSDASAVAVEAGSSAGAAAGTGGGGAGRPAATATAAAAAGMTGSRRRASTSATQSGRGAAGSAAAPTSAGEGGTVAAGGGVVVVAVSGGAGAAAGGGVVVAVSGGAGAAAGSGGRAADYEPCPMNDVCVILPLGDSITYGIGFDGGYRVELFKSANSDGKKITFTGSLSNGPSMVDGVSFPRSNEGHSGWTIDQLVPLIPMPALETPPNIVLLMIGTNDVAQNDDLANAPKRLGALLDKLAMNAPDALIVLATILPFGNGGSVKTYNAALPELVKTRADAGMHIELIDQFSDFPTSELGDGVHPNQQGYKRMAGVWYAAISKLLH